MRASRSTRAALALLVLALLACSLTQRGTPTPTATPVVQAEASATPPPPTEGETAATEPPPTVTAVPTSEPTATTPPTTAPEETAAPTTPATEEAEGCTFDAGLVSDVTVPDGTAFAPGTPFVKTWRLRNTGTCDWEAGTKLVFASGDHMKGLDALTVGAVATGTDIDASVNLEAPMTPGTYQGNWQLETPEGMRFGSVIYVQIVVPAPTVEVTSTREPTETPEATETPEGCVAPHPDLAQLLDLAEVKGYDIGCPTSGAYTVQKDGATGALQAFWANVEEPNPSLHYRSLMIWRADTQQIYVIDGVHTTEAAEGALTVYADTWEEGQPHTHPDCASMTPPAGYRLPERGFGKVWCEKGLVDEVGWPQEPEVQIGLLVQPTEHGLLMKTAGPNANYRVLLMPGAAVGVATWPAQ